MRIPGVKDSRIRVKCLKNYKELMQKAALSIPSNIAEGYERKTTPEYLRSHYIVYGSTCELETQILLSGDLGYRNKESLSELQRNIGGVEKMLKALTKSLENKHLNP